MPSRRLCIPALLVFGALAGRVGAADVEPTWAVRFGTPQIASASVGLLVGKIEPRQPPATGTQLPSGLLLQIEPGLGGAKASLGYAKGLLPYAAGGIKVSILRTWGHPAFTHARQTYVGVEGQAAFFVSLNLGVLRRVGGTGEAPHWLVTGGVGLGF